jgi:hypothetical protein
MDRLTSHDRDIIAQADKLGTLMGADAFREHAGETDLGLAHATALARAQHLLREQGAIIRRLAGSGE